MCYRRPADRMARNAPSFRTLLRRLRQAGAALAIATLLVFLPGGNPIPRVRGSLATLRNTAGSDLRARRMSGRGPAYDRRFFELVLAARDALPPGTKGIALYAPEIPEWGGRYLAIYELAPIPVVAQPGKIPAGWAALVYGREWPGGWRVLRSLPGGALLAP
jgi:hypothetical protein